MTVDESFNGQSLSKELFDYLSNIVKQIGLVDVRVSKTQISFQRGKAFAWVWMPGKYQRGKIAPLVLTFVFHGKDASPRWKKQQDFAAFYAKEGVRFWYEY